MLCTIISTDSTGNRINFIAKEMCYDFYTQKMQRQF